MLTRMLGLQSFVLTLETVACSPTCHYIQPTKESCFQLNVNKVELSCFVLWSFFDTKLRQQSSPIMMRTIIIEQNMFPVVN